VLPYKPHFPTFKPSMHSYGVTNFDYSLVWFVSVGGEIPLQPDTNSCSQSMLWNTPCSCRRRDTDINGQTDRLKIDRQTDTDRHTDQNIRFRHRHRHKHRHTCTRHKHRSTCMCTCTCTHVHADTDEHCVYHIYTHNRTQFYSLFNGNISQTIVTTVARTDTARRCRGCSITPALAQVSYDSSKRCVVKRWAPQNLRRFLYKSAQQPFYTLMWISCETRQTKNTDMNNCYKWPVHYIPDTLTANGSACPLKCAATMTCPRRLHRWAACDYRERRRKRDIDRQTHIPPPSHTHTHTLTHIHTLVQRISQTNSATPNFRWFPDTVRTHTHIHTTHALLSSMHAVSSTFMYFLSLYLSRSLCIRFSV